MAEPLLVPQSAFAGISVAAAGHGVIASDRDGLGLATVLIRAGQADALAERMKTLFGIELPRGPRRVAGNGVAFARIGPDALLAAGESGGNAFSASLKEAFGDLTAVIDQSDGYAVLRLSGPRVREVLAKGVSLDLHPRRFAVGDVAATIVSHIGATLWRLDDGKDGSPVFEVMIFRSLSVSFWDWLCESGAEFGLTLAPTEPLRS
jgi:sarcosine oxidase subunit gamma